MCLEASGLSLKKFIEGYEDIMKQPIINRTEQNRIEKKFGGGKLNDDDCVPNSFPFSAPCQ